MIKTIASMMPNTAPFFGKKDNVKKIIFSILTKEYPLKTIQLTNYIRKRYAKSVTFQGVRCALLELIDEGIVVKDNNAYSINNNWVLESKRYLDELYSGLQKRTAAPKGLDSIKGEISVFSFSSINDLTMFWQDIMDDWLKHTSTEGKETTSYQAAHLWEGLLHLDKEKALMTQLKKKKIKAFILSIGNTPLDKNMKRFYADLGVKVSLNPSLSAFDKSYYVGVYGDIIVQTEYPKKTVSALDEFFKKNNTLENLDLKTLSDIVNQKTEAKLIVIKNRLMAKQIAQTIVSQME
ncbi:MAG: hypothetical protein V1659_04165 [Candidatus Woesearchaeota archaeon]